MIGLLGVFGRLGAMANAKTQGDGPGRGLGLPKRRDCFDLLFVLVIGLDHFLLDSITVVFMNVYDDQYSKKDDL